MLDDSVENEMITTKFWNAIQRRVFGKNKAMRVAKTSKLSSYDIPSLMKSHSQQQLQVTGCIICNEEISTKSRPNISSTRAMASLDSMLDVLHQRIQL